MAATVVGCSESERNGANPAMSDKGALDRPNLLGTPREEARIFFSGHSLMDRPLPDFVEKVAASLSTPAQWNRQYVVGSSIQRRTRGLDPNVQDWRGYLEGYNREGEGLDVIAELRAPRTIEAPSYDVFVITEEHTMLEAMISGGTIRHLRHFHDRFIEGNAAGTTFFYESWFGVDDKTDPRRWIAYERAASPIWQCMATRINESLENEGRSDRLMSLPAGAALAELIERATQGDGLDSITRANVFDTVDSIIGDDVHLHPLGIYYMSLVTYASVYQRSPVGAWHPEMVTPAQAATLQRFAWDYVSRYYERYRPLTLEMCRERLLSDDGLAPLWAYVREAYWRKDSSRLRSYARYARRLFNSRQLLKRADSDNPFYFDPAIDKGYWYPAPVGR